MGKMSMQIGDVIHTLKEGEHIHIVWNANPQVVLNGRTLGRVRVGAIVRAAGRGVRVTVHRAAIHAFRDHPSVRFSAGDSKDRFNMQIVEADHV